MPSAYAGPKEETAKVSISLGTNKATPSTKPQSKLGVHSALNEGDDEDITPQVHEVSHFDQSAGGAVGHEGPKQEKAPLIIKSQPSRNWGQRIKQGRQRSSLPAHAQAHEEGKKGRIVGKREEVLHSSTAYGLTIVSNPEQRGDHASAKNGIKAASADAKIEHSPARQREKTDDELALEALTGKAPQSTLTIPAVLSEDEAFQRDYDSAPDPPTLEQYAAVPVEEFGAALLRGMGWKDGEGIGKNRSQQKTKPTEVKRRPALLGLGAKSEASLGVELGAWGKAAVAGKAKSGRRIEQSYNPLILRNKKTGELITEEELKKRLEEQKGMVFGKETDERRLSNEDMAVTRRDDPDKGYHRGYHELPRKSKSSDHGQARDRNRNQRKMDEEEDSGGERYYLRAHDSGSSRVTMKTRHEREEEIHRSSIGRGRDDLSKVQYRQRGKDHSNGKYRMRSRSSSRGGGSRRRGQEYDAYHYKREPERGHKERVERYSSSARRDSDLR